MPRYNVEIPIAGYVQVTTEVDSDDEDDIFESAIEEYYKDEKDKVAIIEWEFYQYISEGNVLNVDVNEWSYSEIENDGEILEP
jgi:hypothetical protein